MKRDPLAITEAQLQRAVVSLARTLGYESIYHTRYSVGCDRGSKGFPDLVMIRPAARGRPARLVVAELKGPRGVVAPEQRAWLDAFASVPGVSAYLWWPVDIADARAQGSVIYEALV